MVNLAWTGVRYTPVKNFDLVGAAYYYRQNSYGTGATAGCHTSVAATCSGYFEAYSINADYSLTPRFMTYLGAMYSAVYNGVASGDTQRNNINPTIGLRFTFLTVDQHALSLGATIPLQVRQSG